MQKIQHPEFRHIAEKVRKPKNDIKLEKDHKTGNRSKPE